MLTTLDTKVAYYHTMKTERFDSYKNGPAAVSCEPLHLFLGIGNLQGETVKASQ